MCFNLKLYMKYLKQSLTIIVIILVLFAFKAVIFSNIIFIEMSDMLLHAFILMDTLFPLVVFALFIVVISNMLRYVFLSYHDIERMLRGKTKYYANFAPLSFIIPIINIIFPIIIVNEMVEFIDPENKKKYTFFKTMYVVNIANFFINTLVYTYKSTFPWLNGISLVISQIITTIIFILVTGITAKRFYQAQVEYYNN